MNKDIILCNRKSYGGLRAGPVRYIVVHYTAGDGDTAAGNGRYFSRVPQQASAHWFVDEQEAVASVPEKYVAWHCGADIYVHPECRNANSIGVELCSRKDAQGDYYFTDPTVRNALELVKELMDKYNVPAERVIRHYDVTGKICPAPFVGKGAEDWRAFKKMLTEKRYDTMDDMPTWAKPTVGKLLNKDILQGTGKGLDLSMDMLRMLVILDRAGEFD